MSTKHNDLTDKQSYKEALAKAFRPRSVEDLGRFSKVPYFLSMSRQQVGVALKQFTM